MFRPQSPSPSIAGSLSQTGTSHDTDREDSGSSTPNKTPKPPHYRKISERNGSGADWARRSQDDDGIRTGKKAKTSVFSRVFKSSSDHGTSGDELHHPLVDKKNTTSSNPTTPPEPNDPSSDQPGNSVYTPSKKGSGRARPLSLHLPSDLELPPTVNNLDPELRSDLLRKNRKLQQVLGADFSGALASRQTHSDDGAVRAGSLDSIRIADGPANISTSHLILNQSKEGITRGSVNSISNANKLTKMPSHPTRRVRSASVSSPQTPSSMYSFTTDGGDIALRSPSSPGVLFHTPTMNLIAPTPALGGTFNPRQEAVSQVPKDASGPKSGNQEPSPQSFGPSASDFLVTPASEKSNIEALNLQNEPYERGRKLSSPRTATSQHLAVHQNSQRALSTPPAGPHMDTVSTLALSSTSHLSHYRSRSTSTIETVGTWSSEAAVALERKKKRARLVKLHRFLGSSVPAELVLGVRPPGESGLPAPPLRVSTSSKSTSDDFTGNQDGLLHPEDALAAKKWKKPWKGSVKRKNGGGSSASPSPGSASENMDFDWDLCEPMSEQDRVFNVKRKAKMEKLFGANPPQGLFLSRSTSDNGTHVNIDPFGSPTSDPEDEDGNNLLRGEMDGKIRSSEFMKHRNSLNSLSYIVEKEDRESLKNLYQEITKDESDDSDLDEEIIFALPENIGELLDDDEDEMDERPARAKQLIRARRHYRQLSLPPEKVPQNVGSSPSSLLDPSSSPLRSIPPRKLSKARTSEIANQHRKPLSPTTSEWFDDSSPGDAASSSDLFFQLRRKRAAKLTKFFGTDHRSLFGEVLESIECGVQDDQKRGSLTPEEAQELLRALRKLKAKQNVFK